MGVPGEGVGVSEGDDPVSARTEGLRQRRLVAHRIEGAGGPLPALFNATDANGIATNYDATHATAIDAKRYRC